MWPVRRLAASVITRLEILTAPTVLSVDLVQVSLGRKPWLVRGRLYPLLINNPTTCMWRVAEA